MRTQPPASSLPAPADAPAGSEQYSLTKILAIWAAVTAPMAVLVFVVGPAIRPHTSIHPGLVHWMLVVVGMCWLFVVSVAVLRHELGGLHWPAIKQRIWLDRPRDPATDARRRVLWWWAVPAIAANVLGGILAMRLDAAWSHLTGLSEPSFAKVGELADPQFEGQGGSSAWP